MPAFFGRTYFCESCSKPYTHKGKHNCKNKCSACYHEPPCFRIKIFQCKDCNRLFKNKKCFENHKAIYKKPVKILPTRKAGQVCKQKLITDKGKPQIVPEASICDRFRRCTVCFKQFSIQDFTDHKCGYSKCRFCKEEVILRGKV